VKFITNNTVKESPWVACVVLFSRRPWCAYVIVTSKANRIPVFSNGLVLG